MRCDPSIRAAAIFTCSGGRVGAVIVVRSFPVTANERVQLERKLAALRPAWGRARDDLNELAAILNAAEHAADPSGPCAVAGLLWL